GAVFGHGRAPVRACAGAARRSGVCGIDRGWTGAERAVLAPAGVALARLWRHNTRRMVSFGGGGGGGAMASPMGIVALLVVVAVACGGLVFAGGGLVFACGGLVFAGGGLVFACGGSCCLRRHSLAAGWCLSGEAI